VSEVEPLPTDAILLPLLHTPPDVVVASMVEAPAHTFIVPVIAAGDDNTLIVATALHPLPSE
jgi:hypothetical protein